MFDSGPPNNKPILHYVLGLRFGKVVRKTREKREKNATGLSFYTTYSVL